MNAEPPRWIGNSQTSHKFLPSAILVLRVTVPSASLVADIFLGYGGRSRALELEASGRIQVEPSTMMRCREAGVMVLQSSPKALSELRRIEK